MKVTPYQQVLVLNRAYQPLMVVSAQRAVILLVRGVAEAVEGVARIFRSPSVEFVVPSVVRVPECQRSAWSAGVVTPQDVRQRDAYTCWYCGARPGTVKRGYTLTLADFTRDHVLPRSRGGPTSKDNLVTACVFCNNRKGARTPEEAGMRLTPPPTAHLPGPRLRVPPDMPPEWTSYLPQSKSTPYR